MSLKNSLDKLKQAIHAARLPPIPKKIMPGQLLDGTWNPDCCIFIHYNGPNDPKVILYCKDGGYHLEIGDNEVAENAKLCQDTSVEQLG